MDTDKINALFHPLQLPHHYMAKTGESVTIALPRIPLSRYTEFLQVDREKRGDTNCFIEEVAEPQGEGSLLPRQIRGKAICPGKIHIVFNAKDRVSGQCVPGVEPLDILVEVQHSEITSQSISKLSDIRYSKQVRFKPWIGKNYAKDNPWGMRLLILGESHYDREGLPENHNFTIELIEKYANGNKFDLWKPTFLTKILNTVVGSQGSPTVEDKRAFWNSVAFYNYIQEFVGNNHGQAPTKRMWNDAQIPFQEISVKLEPACLLVISKRLWDNMPSASQELREISVNGKSMEMRMYGSILSGYINHVSSVGFKSADWHPLVVRLLEMAQVSK